MTFPSTDILNTLPQLFLKIGKATPKDYWDIIYIKWKLGPFLSN